MSVVKDVDLEAMPTSIFVNDDDDDNDDLINAIGWRKISCLCLLTPSYSLVCPLGLTLRLTASDTRANVVGRHRGPTVVSKESWQEKPF